MQRLLIPKESKSVETTKKWKWTATVNFKWIFERSAACTFYPIPPFLFPLFLFFFLRPVNTRARTHTHTQHVTHSSNWCNFCHLERSKIGCMMIIIIDTETRYQWRWIDRVVVSKNHTAHDLLLPECYLWKSKSNPSTYVLFPNQMWNEKNCD